MLIIKRSVDNLDDFKAYIKRVDLLGNMGTDKNLQEAIKLKCAETLEKVMNQRLGGTTNDESIDLYKRRNFIKDTENGFIIFNNAKIPANVKGVQNTKSNYEFGMFSIALAFEYGVGIVGMSTNNPNAWEYNKNNYNFGWFLPKDVADKYGIPRNQEFGGYRGLEIYRYTAKEINANLKKWVDDYYRKRGVGNK